MMIVPVSHIAIVIIMIQIATAAAAAAAANEQSFYNDHVERKQGM